VPTPEVAPTLLGRATLKWKLEVMERRFEIGGEKKQSTWGGGGWSNIYHRFECKKINMIPLWPR
jgi:hypothetical protein